MATRRQGVSFITELPVPFVTSQTNDPAALSGNTSEPPVVGLFAVTKQMGFLQLVGHSSLKASDGCEL